MVEKRGATGNGRGSREGRHSWSGAQWHLATFVIGLVTGSPTPGMLLPTVINPKSPKPRNRGRHKVALTPKVACYVFFVLFNVGWFGYTMLSMRRRSPHRRPPQTAPDVYIRGTAQQQGPQHGRDGLLKQSIDIEQLEPMQSGLFQPGRVAVSLQPGAVDDLVGC